MKHISTRFLPFLLAFGVAFSQCVANASHTSTNGDYTYSLEDGQATIILYTGSEQSLTIPGQLGGYPVTAIGDDAFSECKSLTYVYVPDGVLTIGEYAFTWCENLSGITIPSSVTSIGTGAFWGCPNLTNVIIPDGVVSIEDFTFYGCGSLASVTIPASVTSIGVEVFESCNLLTMAVTLNSTAQQYAIENGVPHTLIQVTNNASLTDSTTAIFNIGGNTAVDAGATLLLRVETSTDIDNLQLINEDNDEISRQNKWLTEKEGIKTWELAWKARGSKNRTLTVRAHGTNGYTDQKVLVTVSGSAPPNANKQQADPQSRGPGVYADVIIGPPQ